MLLIHASAAEPAYGFEQLHYLTGIMPTTPVHWLTDADPRPADSSARSVVFPAAAPAGAWPTAVPGRVVGRTLHVDVNLPGWVAHALGRYEEQAAPRDRHGRMPLAASAAFKAGTHQTAYLDRLVAQFKAVWLDFMAGQDVAWAELRPAPQPLLGLTHDVDSISGQSWLRYGAWLARAARSGRPSALRAAWARVRRYAGQAGDPHFSFARYREIEARHGFKSTFFVLSLPFFLGRERRRYALRAPRLRAALADLARQGWEIGLHPSRATHLSRARLKGELGRFRRQLPFAPNPPGIRNHYLKAQFPETWRMQEDLGIPYDATLGWAEAPGFRAGTARPYQAFDRGRGRKLSTWVVPLVAMDGAMPAGPADSLVQTCEQLAAECFAHGNPLVLLWHTDRLGPLDYPAFAEAYPRLLARFAEQGCRGLTCRDLVAQYQRYADRLGEQRTFV